ncbi:hypothetical protein RN001_015588 [Aquatica leii]|uniref:Peptidase S1 domain-containing protein n=1 Tax=Aquatica leii TaxID=1421715 RepID=A0AAN7NX14_9COLE|nr:hypothetical protein RN001_015588 [Aquatica leii]
MYIQICGSFYLINLVLSKSVTTQIYPIATTQRSTSEEPLSRYEQGLEDYDELQYRQGRGMMSDDYDHDHDHEMKDMPKEVMEQKAIANDAWAGYYDFIINEGSFKFWAVFQLVTAVLLIYSALAAVYYAKFNVVTTDYDYYYDFFGRSDGRRLDSSSSWFGLNAQTFQTILDAISSKNDMETFCASAPHSKHRAALTSSSFYQSSPYGRNLRQNDYSLPSRSHQSTMLWHHRSQQNMEKPKSKVTSVALAGGAFLVFVAVLSIGGLALYMGVLRTEAPTQLLTYNCSAKIMRGDRFLNNLQEKARKYKQQLEILYHRSSIGPALTSCTVERFGDDSVTIYFRISLNKKSLSRNISNLEKTLKEILLNDSLSRRPVFRHVRFDPRSVQIRQVLDNTTLHDKVVTKLKDAVKPKPGVFLKPNYKQSTNATTEQSIKKLEETIVDKQLPILQGSFEISKTEADITEKKNLGKVVTTLKPTTKTTPKGAFVTSNFYKIATVRRDVEKSTQSTIKTKNTTTTTTSKANLTSTTPTKTTSLASTTTKKITNPFFFTIPSHSIDQEPWVPIKGALETDQHTISVKVDSQVSPPRIENEQASHPIYTSFTNPGLSFYSANLEKLGATSIVGHPLPVDKIAAVTEAPYFTVQYEKLEDDTLLSTDTKNIDINENIKVPEDQTETFVEVEILKHVPGTTGINLEEETGSVTKLNWELLNGSTTGTEIDMFNRSDNTLRKSSVKLNDSILLANISLIFHNLASSLGVLPKSTVFISTTTTIPTTKLRILNDTINLKENIDDIEESDFGKGHAEVVEVDDDSIMLETQASTKIPLVTLIPVKSNSGIGRPLRPRPHKPSNFTDLVENRSFPSNSFIKNLNTEFSALPIKFVHTEVVTSVSTEVNKVKINKNQLNDYQVLSNLKFETESDKSETTTPFVKEHGLYKKSNVNNDTEVNRNPKRDSKETVLNKETLVYSMNSSVSISKGNAHLNVLTEDKLKQLSEISKINANLSIRENEPVLSNKAISASYTNNQAGFKILTKTLNKIPGFNKDEKSGYGLNVIVVGGGVSNKTDCSNHTIKCGDGQCLPETTRCNQLVDCSDGTDEKNCNCADYLKSQYLLRKICDGVVDCWDFSDENLCEWCNPSQYVCSNSKFCIDKNKICDGTRDCPNGDDERQCVTVAPDVKAADEYPYHSDGYLLVRKNGQWGKLCLENSFEKVGLSWKISNLGEAVCKSRTYQKLDVIETKNDSFLSNSDKNFKYFEVSHPLQNITNGNLSFKESSCDSRNVIKLRCHALECGTRPQAVNQLARRMYRIVGGGNAGLGAWPWQAALYKEGEFQCGATLLTDRWLLSAGHCFFHSLEDHWVARMGALRRGTALPSPYEQLRPIVQIILHPGYIDVGFVNDISLLQMETHVVFSDYVRPICLPSFQTVLKDNRICTVIGWGQLFEVGRIFPDTLQEVQVPVISTAECRKHTLFLPLYKITDDMFCAGYDRGGRDACLGDSGGPLMCSEPDGRWMLYGITSNGYGCARANRPGVYTKVANYLTWIYSYINDINKNSNKVVKTVCYGHRCPLGECLPKSRLCNGYIECSDGSDEKNCPEHL